LTFTLIVRLAALALLSTTLMFLLVTLVLLLATFVLVPAVVAALLTSSASFLAHCRRAFARRSGRHLADNELDRHIVGWIANAAAPREIARNDVAPSGDSTSRATQSRGNVRSS